MKDIAIGMLDVGEQQRQNYREVFLVYGEKKYKLEILDNIDGSVSTPLFKEENYYLPITLSRTSSNPNMVENPGYE